MICTDFKSEQLGLIAEDWRNAPDGVLLDVAVGRYFLKVVKEPKLYFLFLFNPAAGKPDQKLDLRCGCPLEDQWHWHHWEYFTTADKAVEATAWAIDAIERGVSVKLANSTQVPF